MAGAAGTQRATVAEGATAELPASGPEARLGPMDSYCSCAGAPRADGRRSTAAAGRRGRPRRSWGLPPLAWVCGEAKLGDNSLSLHVECRECNLFCSAFFCFAPCQVPNRLPNIDAAFSTLYIAVKHFPFSGDKVTFFELKFLVFCMSGCTEIQTV
ncbi:hypothetical protein PVAP13_9NG076359 [Panicum virgatum]|uniref:Uncharacterized protein n=1 Tax=Panicum virgatum TaxID=38727 RepID=A0A8T0MC71_PANVG|nr:hypothetical protein PVAP13_9NG076359 [Panicum virgatum]